jgi:hypothetical protein
MKKVNVKSALVLVTICLLLSSNALAATTRTAASCSAANIQTQVNASTDGDTVNVPSGTCSWAAGDVVSWTDKGINLIGGNGGTTTINAAGKFAYTTINESAHVPRISGFTINSSSYEPVISLTSSAAASVVTGWRIDNIRIVHSAASGQTILVVGPSWGLIDHIAVSGTGGGWGQIELDGYLDSEYNRLPTLMGNASVAATGTALGTAKAVFVEDSTFTFNVSSSGVINSKMGAAYVFRYNTVIGSMVQTHAARTGERGGVKFETYNNVFNGAYSGGNFYHPSLIRSGTGVIFNNKVSGYNMNSFHIDNERTFPACFDSGVGNPPLVRCDGSHPAYDGNIGTGNQAGWPCLDQIGWVGAYPTQTSVPLYAWNNGPQTDCTTTQATCDGSVRVAIQNDGDLCGGHPYTSDHIKATGDANPHPGGIVDYVNNARTPKPGYTPYTYPHPLQTGGGNDSLTPPGNLRIAQ